MLLKAALYPNWIGTVVAQDLPFMKTGAIRDAETIIGSSEFLSGQLRSKHVNKAYFFDNNSIVEFTSYDDEQDAKQGKRNALFINEAQGVKSSVYDQLAIRTSDDIYIDYNPDIRFWVHDKIIPREDSDLIISNFTHNSEIKESILREILDYRFSNKNKYAVYARGMTGKREGLIFKNVYHKHGWPGHVKVLAYAIDPGFTNDPTAIVKIGVHGNDLYTEQVAYERRMHNSDRRDALIYSGAEYHIPLIIDAAYPEMISWFQNQGWNALRSNSRGGAIKYGIELMDEFDRIYIVNGTEDGAIKESENYKWKFVGGRYINVPIDKFNHFWDATRYAVLYVNGEDYLEDDEYKIYR